MLIKLNKSDEGSKDRASERWEYPPGRGRIIPDSEAPRPQGGVKGHVPANNVPFAYGKRKEGEL